MGFVALAVRVLVAARTAAIYPDGAIYLRMAEDFLAGELDSGLRRVFHPAYPALIAPWIALGGRLGVGPETCASAVSAVLGAVTVGLLGGIAAEWARAVRPGPDAAAGPESTAATTPELHTRQSAGLETPLIAGLVGAGVALLHPALLLPSGQVQAYAWTHAACAAALLAACRALRPRSVSGAGCELGPWSVMTPAALAGLAAGLGFLGRPDMILAAAGLGAGLLISPWLDRRTGQAPELSTAPPASLDSPSSPSSPSSPASAASLTPSRTALALARALPFALGFLIAAGPYIGWVSLQSGRLRLSLKKDPAAWLTAQDGAVEVPDDRFAALREALNAARGVKHQRGASASRPSLVAAARYALKQSGKAAPHWLLVTAALGLVLVIRGGRGGLAALVVLPGLAFLAGHTILRWKAGYLSTMHTSYQALLVIPPTALVLPALASRLARRILPAASERLAAHRGRVALAVLVALIMVPGLPVLASRPQEHKAVARELGAVLRRHGPADGARPLLVGEEVRQVAWYGGADFLPATPNPAERRRIERAARAGRAFLLVYLRVRGALPMERLRPLLDAIGPELTAPRIVKRGDRRYLWWLRRIRPLRPQQPPAGEPRSAPGPSGEGGPRRARSAGPK